MLAQLTDKDKKELLLLMPTLSAKLKGQKAYGILHFVRCWQFINLSKWEF